MFNWDKRVATLFLIVLVNFLGGTIVLPTLPLYSSHRFDASPEMISVLLASYFLAQFLAAPVMGRMSDRVGRLPVLIVSQLGTFISFVMMAGAESLWVLFAARVLDGITGGNVIVAQAYMTDITPRERRTQALGLIFAAFGLGYIVGPAVGGLLAAAFDDRAPFYVGAVISLGTVLLTYFTLDESLTPEERMARRGAGQSRMSPRDILGNVPLVLILVIGFGAQFSIALFQSTIALFGEAVLFKGYSQQSVNLGVGLMLTGIGIGQFITQIALIRPLVSRFGERRLVVIGAVLRAISMFSVAVIASPLLVGAGSLTLLAVASGIMMPSLQSLATMSVSEDISGGVLGIYGSATSLGVIVGTFLGGQIFAITPNLPYVVAGSVLLITVIPALILLRNGSTPVAGGAAAA